MRKIGLAIVTFVCILSAATFSGITAHAASSGTTVDNLSITTARCTRYHHTSHSGKHIRLQVHSCAYTDTDGDGICDNCLWDEDYHAGHHAGTCSSLGASCHITDGHCSNYTDADGNGFCDNCHNPIFCPSAITGQGTSSGQASADSQADTSQAITQQPAGGSTGSAGNAGSTQNSTGTTDSTYPAQGYGGHHGCGSRLGHHRGHH